MTAIPTHMLVNVSGLRVGDMVSIKPYGWRRVVGLSTPWADQICVAYDGGMDAMFLDEELPILRPSMPPPELCS